MDTETALSFLAAHQPLPPDDLMSDEVIRTYNEARKFFIAHPDNRCIDLFLGSFGVGSGFGVYQIVDEVLCQHPQAEVVASLVAHLRSPDRYIRYWCADNAASFPDPALVEPLSVLLQEEDRDIRAAAVSALFTIQEPLVGLILRSALTQESDAPLKEQMRNALEYREKRQLDA